MSERFLVEVRTFQYLLYYTCASKHRIIYRFWFAFFTGYLKCHERICIHFVSSSLFESTGLWRAGWPCTYHIQQETLLSTLNIKIYNISSCKIRTLGCHGIRRFLCSISADQRYGWIINSSKQGTKKDKQIKCWRSSVSLDTARLQLKDVQLWEWSVSQTRMMGSLHAPWKKVEIHDEGVAWVFKTDECTPEKDGIIVLKRANLVRK